MRKMLDVLNDLCSKKLYDAKCLPSSMLFCAHPDDEILGAGILISYLKGKIDIVTVTDGAPKNLADTFAAGFASREAYSNARFEEQAKALMYAGVKRSQCHRLSFSDQEASFQMPAICYRIVELIESKKPDIVFTHAFEGGHPDHDATAFAVWAAIAFLKKRRIKPPLVIEYACYHGNGGAEMVYNQFLYSKGTQWTINLNPKEINFKKSMIDCYISQWKTLSSFTLVAENFRPMPNHDFYRPPHHGILLYEFHDWGMSAQMWNKLAVDAAKILGLHKTHG